MAELSNQRYSDMLRYTQQLEAYEDEDLLAAGFSPDEVNQFEAISQSMRNASKPPLTAPEDQAFRAREPTLRESSAATLAELFGGEDYDRGDLLFAQKFTGTADPTATFADSMGLADMLGVGGVYGVEEGADTMVQGARSGDLGTVAVGAGETVLNVLGAVPGAKFFTSAAGKLVDDLLDSSRRAEADKFFLEREADAEGYGAEGADQGRVFVPTEDELAMMRGNPTPAEQVYLDSVELSRRMSDAGESADDILAATGVLNLPVADRFGAPVGTREVYLGGGQDFAPLPGEQVLRGTSEDDFNVRLVPQEELGPRVDGDYNPNTKTVRISKGLDMTDASTTFDHEVAHFDHDVGLMSKPSSLPEMGSSQDYEGQALREKISAIKAVLKDPAQEPLHDTARAVLDDIRKSESAAVNYYNNPGEILARAVSGENVGVDLVSPRERLNPYINPGPGTNTARGLDALLMKLRPDLVDLPLLRNAAPRPVGVPMDVRRGQVNNPDYKFSPR